MADAVPVYNFVWEQGSDLNIPLVYKSGPQGAETPVDLTGYKLRMDVSSAGARVYTFNSDDITDLDGNGTGTDSDLIDEAVLGSDGSINIAIPRSLTLPGGVIYTEMAGGKNVYTYDIFLRDLSNHQTKILSGTITVNKSVTLWA